MAQLSSTKIYGDLFVSSNIFSNGAKVSLETHNHENLYFNKVRGNVSDFNNCVTEGQYSFASGSTIPNGYWSSGGRYGTLVVYVNDGGTHNNDNNWIWQVVYDTHNEIWWRNKVNNTGWGGWQRFSSSHSHPYLSTSGGEISGNLTVTGSIPIGAYRNNSTGLYGGNGDGAGIGTITNNTSSGISNLILNSWYGVGFANTCSGGGPMGINVAINCRTGSIEARGNITAAKVYNAVYNDYAEWFERKDESEFLEPGDIVISNQNTYTKSTKAYQNTVVGVFSDSYGHIVGGEKLDNMEDNIKKFLPIGLSGRVDVKIIGSIKEGDLIVSSDIPGVGMKMENFIPGTVIGKALEDKNTNNIRKVKILIMQM